MSEKHLSSQFDEELGAISTRIMEMGGLVESQTTQAIYALREMHGDVATNILKNELRVNEMEMEIDKELSSIISRRQPTARDLRLLIGISKTIGNLERVGDEAARIARTVHRFLNTGVSSALRQPIHDLAAEAHLAGDLLHDALNAFARLDAAQAAGVIERDPILDQSFEGNMRKLITYMMEDPRHISSCIDLVFVAKAIERIGDHAKNLAEQVIYVVKGQDVRHAAPKITPHAKA